MRQDPLAPSPDETQALGYRAVDLLVNHVHAPEIACAIDDAVHDRLLP